MASLKVGGRVPPREPAWTAEQWGPSGALPSALSVVVTVQGGS